MKNILKSKTRGRGTPDKVVAGVRERSAELLRGKMPTDYKELGRLGIQLSKEYGKLKNHLIQGKAPLLRRDTDLLDRLRTRHDRVVDKREAIRNQRKK